MVARPCNEWSIAAHSGRLLRCLRSTSATALAGEGNDVEDEEAHAVDDPAEPTEVPASQDPARRQVEEAGLQYSDERCAQDRALPQKPQIRAHVREYG